MKTAPEVSVMTVSVARGLTKLCDARKTARGQFHTVHAAWLLPQVLDFMRASRCERVLDPFAGNGDLLTAVQAQFPTWTMHGFDNDPRWASRWPCNDSLLDIPCPAQTLIVTNPPYLAKHSAKRKGVLDRVEHYYQRAQRSDLYQIALDACLRAARRVVAIIPETVINSGLDLSHCCHITIIENHLFDDTDQPVVVACFDREWGCGPDMYRDAQHIASLAHLQQFRIAPCGNADIMFNVAGGAIGLRAVDMPDPRKPIAFMPAAHLDYDAAQIKVSSRLVTFLSVPTVAARHIPAICAQANALLADIRRHSHDVILSPFKGNDKNGRRRRRLDYDLARAILERAMTAIGTMKSQSATSSSHSGRRRSLPNALIDQ